jgi:GAF domain-containing protein
LLFIPLRKDGTLLGYITAARREVRPFSEKEITLLENFAAQAVIAMENARLITETREALEQQTATAEVLQVINSSPGDLRPVFDAMLERAMALCEADYGHVYAFEDGQFSPAAIKGDPGFMSYRRQRGPLRPQGDGTSALERLIAGESVVWAADVHEEQAYRTNARFRELADSAGIRSMATIALRKEDSLRGAIIVYRRQVRPFSQKQIALLRNFAEQAVIAMENARLITETREALEQQTATAEVLQVINTSPGNVTPVFEAMLEKAIRLCGGVQGALWTLDGERVKLAASRNPPEFAARLREHAATGVPEAVQQTMRSHLLHIPDFLEHELYLAGDPIVRAAVELGGFRSWVGVALVKDDAPVGAFVVGRRERRPFTEKQIALLQNFAAQAVIAMENARLITETRDALEQQTATAEVLQVINASPGNLEPVFDTILEKALHLCESPFGLLATYDGEFFHTAAQRGLTQGFVDLIREPFRPPPGLHNERLVRGEQLVHISDITGEEAYRSNPTHRALADQSGARTAVWIALRRDDTLLGVINIYRQEVRAFSDRQIELLRGFAAQAVIAIDNARLLRELRQRTEELARRNSEYGERIEQQSATIDVLKAMSASSGDAQPVFQAIVERARAFCNADNANLALVDGGVLHPQATTITDSENAIYMAQFPRPVDTTSLFGRAILARDVVQTPDVRADAEHFARAGALSGETPVRALVAVPLLRVGVPIGAIVLARNAPGEFSATQVELLRTFAEQAVIAITSAETYRELQERTAALVRRNSEYGERIEQQAATIDVLKAMSASSGDAQPVFRVIVERARAFCNADHANLALVYGDILHMQASTMVGYVTQFPRPVDATSMFGRAILARDAVQTPDIRVDLQHFSRAMSGEVIPRALVGVPLLRAGAPIGAIVLARYAPGEFSTTQIELLRTFAEQAVIAITSAETFTELQRRTAELTRSVAELQALEEVLRAVNSSLELETVLSTIISRAVQLSDADEGTIYEFDDADQVFVPKSAYGMTAERVTALRDRRIRIGETPLGNSAAMRAPLHIPDLTQTLDLDGSRELVGDGIHALLAVPLLRDDKVLGGLVIRRRAVGGFAPTVPTLLQTFAGQCVLAIENARLFQEARQARVEAETTLADLRRTQDRLVQSEKMASLGQLTAGIAHEIKNPLNFVNNFSELSVDLLDELHEAVAPDRLAMAGGLRTEIDELTATLKGNLEKIAEHGRRADSIVRNMLLHSRSGPGEHRMVDLNSTVEEALNLAYHGARAATPGFNITLEKRLDPQAGMVDMYPQEITRVLLNLIGNGFYAAHQRAEAAGSNGFEPTLRLTTRDLGDQVEIRVRDNGTGISEAARDRIFEPFFTTKPAGEGTGLGLSLSYEIIVQQHGGRLTVDSEPDAFTEFVVTLPRKLAATNGGQA